jgi:hypothetical protein
MDMTHVRDADRLGLSFPGIPTWGPKGVVEGVYLTWKVTKDTKRYEKVRIMVSGVLRTYIDIIYIRNGMCQSHTAFLFKKGEKKKKKKKSLPIDESPSP